jgi:hypothetical protein
MESRSKTWKNFIAQSAEAKKFSAHMNKPLCGTLEIITATWSKRMTSIQKLDVWNATGAENLDSLQLMESRSSHE